MTSRTTLFTLCLILVSQISGFTQNNYETLKGKSRFHMKRTFSEMERFDRENPGFFVKEKRKPNKEEFHPVFDVQGDKVLSTASALSGYLISDPSPLPDADFLGLEDNNSSIPPDVNGAVGPDHLMITLNTEIRIMEKTGEPISTISTGSFWYPMPGAGDVFDPKIQYDPYEDRWMLIMPSSSNVLSSALFVAVSENSDPTGAWYFYSFDADPDDDYWFDYPSYGYNKNWIAVSGNMFGDGFGYNVLFVINKGDLYAGLPQAGYTRFAVYDAFTVVPAITLDEQEEDLYMVMNANGNSGGMGYIKLFRVSGAVGNEQVEELGLVAIPDTWDSWSGAEHGNFAPQKDSEEKINSGDGRIQNVIFRNGKLWAAHHVFLPAGDPTRSAIQWYELATDGTALQWGRVDDETGYYHYTFPTIAVNAAEDVMIGYSSFSPDQYASCSYSFRYGDDPPDMLRERYEYMEGLAPYYKTFGAGRNRWGDYSGTVVDPVDDLDFWTLQEYADLPWGGYDHWSTWWAKIKIDAVPEADFTSHITTTPVGSFVNFEDLSRYEPTSWQWIFEGGTPSTSSEQDPQNIVYDTDGTFDVTLIATNDLGSDTLILTDYITASYTILPEVDFAVSDTLPCTGSAVVFEDRSVYNPVAWNWEFEPATVSFSGATTGESQNPEVIFDEPGIYNVTLTATNLNGSSTFAREELVFAGGVFAPFTEGFESNSFASQSWQTDNPDDGKTWETTGTSGLDNSYFSAYINLRYYSVLGQRDRLISPLLNLTAMESSLLEFEYAYAQRFPEYSDSLVVYVAEECGSEWTRVLELAEDTAGGFVTHPPESGNFFPETPDEWCGGENQPLCHILDLSPWAGKHNIRIVFESYSGYGNNLFIDNVNIHSPESIFSRETGNRDLLIYPNPSYGEFVISLEKRSGKFSVEVNSLSGKLLYAESFIFHGRDMQKRLDLSDLPKGIYLLTVKNDDERYHSKISLK